MYSNALWARKRLCAGVTCMWMTGLNGTLNILLNISYSISSRICKICPNTANMSTRDYSVMWWPWLTPWYYRFIIPINQLPRSLISVAYLHQIHISLEVWNHHVDVSPELEELRLPQQAPNPFLLITKIIKQYWQVHNSLHVLMQVLWQCCNEPEFQKWVALEVCCLTKCLLVGSLMW